MKLKKYDNGGIIYTPFLGLQEESKTTETSTKKDSSDEIKKEIMSVLKENGLPSDVDYFLNQANNFLSNSWNLFSGLDNGDYGIDQLINLQSLANKVKFNNKLHETAVNQIVKEGSGSEIALTNTGGMYVIDEDMNIKVMSVSDYHDSEGKYRALTNSELIHLRENDPQLAYQSSILTDLSNTIGMKSITDQVKNIISSFGKIDIKNQTESYTAKQQGKIQQGFEQLLGLAPDGYYKINSTSQSIHQGYDSEESLKQAVDYLYKSLPQNMKHVLRANAAAMGLNPNKIEDVQQLLIQAITEQTDHTFHEQVQIDEESANGSGSGSGSGDGKLEKMHSAESMAVGRITDPIPSIIANSKSKGGIQMMAQPYTVIDKNSNQIGEGRLSDVLRESTVGTIIDPNSIFFGDTRLGNLDLDRVIYDGDGMRRAWLPIDQNYYVQTGIIKPDLNAEARFQEFLAWIDKGYGVTPNSAISKANELNLDIEFKEGVWKFRDNAIHPFMIVNGYTSDKGVDIDVDSDWIHHVDRSEGKRLFDRYKGRVNYGWNASTKGNKSHDPVKGGWLGIGDANSMYKSAIFMPILDEKLATYAYGNERTPISNYVDILNKDRLRREQQSIPTNF